MTVGGVPQRGFFMVFLLWLSVGKGSLVLITFRLKILFHTAQATPLTFVGEMLSNCIVL